jgi:hypothetical protein
LENYVEAKALVQENFAVVACFGGCSRNGEKYISEQDRLPRSRRQSPHNWSNAAPALEQRMFRG